MGLAACRKYRILDDCSRLRDAIELLPTERRFMPAVLLIIWGEAATADIPNDLFDMVSYHHRLDRFLGLTSLSFS